MQQHREVEQHREREARRRTSRPPSPGCDLLDCRGQRSPRSAPRPAARRTATRTSTPPIWPIRSVPGGRALRRRPALPGVAGCVWSTSRGYRGGVDRILSVRSPTSVLTASMTHVAPELAERDRRRRRRRARLPVPEPGQRLHDLPAAVPLPHHRPAPRAVLARRGPRHRRAQGAGGPLRPAGRRPHPGPGRRPAAAGLGEGPRGGARGRRDVRRRRAPRSAPGWRPARSRWAATSRSRTRRRLEPAERESYVETLLDSKLLLRGFIDRLDVAPTGEIRVVDYKTGRRPARPSRPRRCSR